jgi:hypothetical protein
MNILQRRAIDGNVDKRYCAEKMPLRRLHNYAPLSGDRPQSRFGINYVREGEQHTPDGRSPRIRVVWFIETGEEIARLATAYPLKKGKQ